MDPILSKLGTCKFIIRINIEHEFRHFLSLTMIQTIEKITREVKGDLSVLLLTLLS